MKLSVVKQVAIIVAATAAVCTAAMPLHADDKIFTLQEVMVLARENNGSLKALREEAGIHEADKLQAGLYPNPTIDMGFTTGDLTGSKSEDRISIGISQELLTAGKRQKQMTVAETGVTAFEHRLRDADRLLMVEVRSGYFDLLLAESRLELEQKSLENAGQLLHIAKERLAAGDSAELDVNLARVEVARSEGRRIEAEREVVTARQRLLSLIGAPALTQLKIAPLDVKSSMASLAELQELALHNRPDLQLLAAEKAKAEAELALAQAGRFPNVTAGIAFSHEKTVTSIGGLDERSSDNLLELKVSVPLPVFDRNQANVRGAVARTGSAESRLAFVRQSIEREVEAAQGQLTAAEKSLNIYAREIIPQLTENLKLVQEAYRLGEIGIMAVLEEQKKFIDVNKDHLSALHDWNRSLSRLTAAVGIDLKIEDGGNK